MGDRGLCSLHCSEGQDSCISYRRVTLCPPSSRKQTALDGNASSASRSTVSTPFWLKTLSLSDLKLIPLPVLWTLFPLHSLQRVITASVNLQPNLQPFPCYWHFPSALDFLKSFPYQNNINQKIFFTSRSSVFPLYMDLSVSSNRLCSLRVGTVSYFLLYIIAEHGLTHNRCSLSVC